MDEVDVLVALAGAHAARAPRRQILLDRRSRAARSPRRSSLLESAKGESCARLRISFACARPMPASARWSRSSGVQPAVVGGEDLTEPVGAEPERLRRRGAPARPRSAPASRSQTPARFFGAALGQDELASVLEAQPERRRLRALLSRLRDAGIRPALIRWIRSRSSPSSVGKRRHLPRRRAPSNRRPSSVAQRRVERLQRRDVRGTGLRDRRARHGLGRARAPTPRPRVARACDEL